MVSLLTWLLVSFNVQETTARVIIKGYFYQDTLVEIYRVSESEKRQLFDSFTIPGQNRRYEQRQGSDNINMPLRELEIRFTKTGPRTIADQKLNSVLTSIQLIKPFQTHFFFNGENVAKFFVANEGELRNNGELIFESQGKSVTVNSISEIGRTGWQVVAGIPLLFFFGVLLLARSSRLLSLPAFSDIALGNKISTSREFDTINGLRGMAALLVLLSHTAPGFEALQMGLALLFVISGFLLSKPFVLDNTKIFSWANIEHYLTKRLKRILPMYYFYVFLIYVVALKFDTALRHFFFVQGEGHLWPMPQIFTFYMLLPLVLLATSLCHRLHRFLPITVLVTAIYFAFTSMRGWTPYYNGSGYQQFFLFSFLIGVLASYLQYDLLTKPNIVNTGARWRQETFGLVALLFTFFAIAWSAPLVAPTAIFNWLSQFWVKCLSCGLIILMALNTPNSFYRKIVSNWLFRSVGVIGFSFYILHGLGMQLFEQIQIQYFGVSSGAERSWVFVIGSFSITYCMAILSYSLIERPFFGYRAERSGESR